MKILISGIGISGPCLAYWLLKEGRGKHEIVLVEKADKLRDEGYIVDFWGTGYEVMQRMGLESEFKKRGYELGNLDMVDESGKTKASLNIKEFADLYNGKVVSISRGDISRLFFESLPLEKHKTYDDFNEGDKSRIQVRFGIEIINLKTPKANDSARSVFATFSNGDVESFDLVVGADGAFSKVRNLVFGSIGVKELNLTVAAAEVRKTGDHPSFISSHSIPRKTLYTYSIDDNKIVSLFAKHGATDRRNISTPELRKQFLLENFREMKWNAPQILEEIKRLPDVYATNVVQVRLNTWRAPGVVLVGDAAACPSLISGQGAVLAATASYVLAYEINNCDGDIESCLQRYEKALIKSTRKVQKECSSSVSGFVPKTKCGIRFRYFAAKVLGSRLILRSVVKQYLKKYGELPNYDQTIL